MEKMNLLMSFAVCICILAEPLSTQAIEIKDAVYLSEEYQLDDEDFVVIESLSAEELSKIASAVAVNDPEYSKEQRIYYTVHDGGHTAALSKELQDWVYEMCAEYGIPGYEKMVIAKLYCESSFNPSTIHTNTNGTKDYGLAQINSCNHKRLRNILGITDFLDSYQSIRCGVFMISECLQANGYNESMALAAYNTGRNGVSSTPYTRKVLRIKDSASVINN